jgi:FkbH-like protein
VFIDDNPIERARVREALPDVFVPEWPEDKTEYALALQTLKCFDTPRMSREDAERTRMYADERARTEIRMTVSSIDEWLENLQTRVRFVRLSSDNIARSTQLLNKTNQMNARTRRLSEVELRTWSDDSNREVWAVYVSDRLGDAGLTGLLSLELDGRTMNVVDFVLSCRVMGRRVEDSLLSFACTRASARGATALHVPFFETAKNKPCRSFLESTGLELALEEKPYSLYVRDPPDYPKPKGITLEVE